MANQYVDFWQDRYDTRQTPWDLGGPSPHFAHFLNIHGAKFPPGRMAVMGAGRGHDAALFANAGFEVTAFDYAPGAVQEAKRLYGNLFTPVQQDIFSLGSQYQNGFDYVLEHTCFCAIHPNQRQSYVEAVCSLLKPGGVLIGVFWEHDDPQGPPFPTTPDEIRQLFSEHFNIEQEEAFPASTSGRTGIEYQMVIRKKS